MSGQQKVRYAVSSARRVHILDGDVTGGGHRAGAGKGSSEFPRSWSDQAIIDAIESIANDASLKPRKSGSYEILTGVRNGLRIKVVINPRSAVIITGHPD